MPSATQRIGIPRERNNQVDLFDGVPKQVRHDYIFLNAISLAGYPLKVMVNLAPSLMALSIAIFPPKVVTWLYTRYKPMPLLSV